MLLCENKAAVTGVLASWVNVLRERCGMTEERGRETYTCSSSDQGGFMQPTDGLVTLYPHRARGWGPNQNKCLCSSSGAFDQQHILRFRAGLLGTPGAHMESHLYKQVQGGMCEQCDQRIFFSFFCSRNMALTWLMSHLWTVFFLIIICLFF